MPRGSIMLVGAAALVRSWWDDVVDVGWAPRVADPLRPDLLDAGAVGDAVLARRRRDDDLLLAERMRAGVILVFLAMAVIAVTIDPLRRGVFHTLVAMKLVVAVESVWLWRWTRAASGRRLVGGIAASVVLYAALVSVSSTLAGEYWSATLFAILISMGAAGLLPWGVRAQVVVAPIVLGLGLLPMVIVGGGPGVVLLVTTSVLIGGVSVLIAWEQERYRRESWRRLLSFRENMDRLRQVAEHLNGVVWLGELGDWGEAYLYVSPRYDEVWGRPRSALRERPRAWLDAVHPEDRAAVEAAVRRSAAHGGWDCEYRLVRPDGTQRWIHDAAFPIRDADGSARRVARLAQDVTAEREAASAARMRDLVRGIEATREEERRRIARELHDELGQSLTGIRLGLAGVVTGHAVDPAAAGALRACIDEVGVAMEAVHALIHDLRPPVLDDLGLLPALRLQRERFVARADIACDLALPGDEPCLTDEERTVVFRVAQEALTNVARHAQARRVSVRLAVDVRRIALTVADDGRGIAGAAPGFGLRGMAERATLLNGTLRVEARAGGGTVVRLQLPRDARGGSRG